VIAFGFVRVNRRGGIDKFVCRHAISICGFCVFIDNSYIDFGVFNFIFTVGGFRV
jgi:hypothetical protein